MPRPITTMPMPAAKMPSTDTLRTILSRLAGAVKPSSATAKPANNTTAIKRTMVSCVNILKSGRLLGT